MRYPASVREYMRGYLEHGRCHVCNSFVYVSPDHSSRYCFTCGIPKYRTPTAKEQEQAEHRAKILHQIWDEQDAYREACSARLQAAETAEEKRALLREMPSDHPDKERHDRMRAAIEAEVQAYIDADSKNLCPVCDTRCNKRNRYCPNCSLPLYRKATDSEEEIAAHRAFHSTLTCMINDLCRFRALAETLPDQEACSETFAMLEQECVHMRQNLEALWTYPGNGPQTDTEFW